VRSDAANDQALLGRHPEVSVHAAREVFERMVQLPDALHELERRRERRFSGRVLDDRGRVVPSGAG
jgi:hypothetical protein